MWDISDLYSRTDKSKLYKAWREFYKPMRLGNSKFLKLVFKKVKTGKMPIIN